MKIPQLEQLVVGLWTRRNGPKLSHDILDAHYRIHWIKRIAEAEDALRTRMAG